VIPTSNNQESIAYEKKNHTKHVNSVEWKINVTSSAKEHRAQLIE
jgi:hypothetical protein